MMLDTVLGNASTVRDLQDALRANRLMHSVLLCGEAGTGTGYAARCLAADYLYPGNAGEACLRAQSESAAVGKAGAAAQKNAKTQRTHTAAAATAPHGAAASLSPADVGAAQVMAGESAEVLRIAGEGVSGDIKIDSVRSARSAVFHTALSANGRVVHIDGAQHLNNASANALLKVLEEPPEGVLFLLTAPGEASVLPTLRSRCACYTLAPVSEAVCADYLRKRFANEQNIARFAPEYAALFGGKIGMGVRCLTDEAKRKNLEAAKNLAEAVQAGDAYYALITLAAQEKDRATARAFLSMAREVFAAALRGSYPALDADKASRALEAVREADGRLARNGSAKLVFSCLAANLTPS